MRPCGWECGSDSSEGELIAELGVPEWDGSCAGRRFVIKVEEYLDSGSRGRGGLAGEWGADDKDHIPHAAVGWEGAGDVH